MNLRSWLLNLVSPILTDRELSQIESQSVVEGEAIAEAKVRGLQTGVDLNRKTLQICRGRIWNEGKVRIVEF